MLEVSAMDKIMEAYAAKRENMIYEMLELIKDGLTDSKIINRLGCSIEQINRGRKAISWEWSYYDNSND